jgi:ribosome-associated protein
MPNSNRGNTGFQSSEFQEQYDRPSKSQLKRESTALQKLGEELVNEPRDRVMRVPMPDEVREAILECQQIRDHEGRRRQMQFVGKRMRALTEDEVAVIRKTIDSWRGSSRAETAALHALERWRDKLIADDAALTALRERYPQVDMQQLRTMIRNARREAEQSKPPKAYREIFQLLKQLQAEAAGGAKADEQDQDESEDDDA